MTPYDTLACRLYVSRDFVKRTLHAMGYGAELDPWLRYLFEIELTRTV